MFSGGYRKGALGMNGLISLMYILYYLAVIVLMEVDMSNLNTWYIIFYISEKVELSVIFKKNT